MNFPFSASSTPAQKDAQRVADALTHRPGGPPADGADVSWASNKARSAPGVAQAETETLDSELVVAVFRIVVLLIAFLVPRV
jgi:hypothetical protein